MKETLVKAVGFHASTQPTDPYYLMEGHSNDTNRSKISLSMDLKIVVSSATKICDRVFLALTLALEHTYRLDIANKVSRNYNFRFTPSIDKSNN